MWRIGMENIGVWSHAMVEVLYFKRRYQEYFSRQAWELDTTRAFEWQLFLIRVVKVVELIIQ